MPYRSSRLLLDVGQYENAEAEARLLPDCKFRARAAAFPSKENEDEPAAPAVRAVESLLEAEDAPGMVDEPPAGTL